MSEDPMMPARDRLPREMWPPLRSSESPSAHRPWGLRHVRPVDEAVTGEALTAKHRTSPHNTPQKQTTVNDGTTSDDTWTTPDD